MKKLIALLLTIGLTLGVLPPMPVSAGNGEIWYAAVNPLYADTVTEAALIALTQTRQTGSVRSATAYVDWDTAVTQLRLGLESRADTVEVSFAVTEAPDSSTLDQLFTQATAHTGDPKGGDYLRYSAYGYSCNGGYYYSEGSYLLTITYYPVWFTTAAQEAEVDTAVQTVLEALDVYDASDYEKIRAVYDYICNHVTYDYDHLGDMEYKLQQSAYGALILGTSVCQGYALLLYRLLLELDVDCRYITGYGDGESHAWNIVAIGELYYNMDATWDASLANTTYSYFLRGQDTFTSHTRDAAFSTDDFLTAYPMSPTDYSAVHEHSYTNTVTEPTCTEQGYTTHTCTQCGDSYADSYVDAKGHSYTDTVTEPTCTEPGYTTHTCTRCSDCFTDSATEPLGHTPGTGVRENEGAHDEHDQVIYCDRCELELERTHVAPYIPGDINGDGAVNNKDLTRFFQYLSDCDVEVNTRALDINGDGAVDEEDLTLLFQYLSDWNVTLP